MTHTVETPLREILLQVLNDNIYWEGWTGSDEDLLVAIDAILVRFTVKPVRRVKP